MRPRKGFWYEPKGKKEEINYFDCKYYKGSCSVHNEKSFVDYCFYLMGTNYSSSLIQDKLICNK